MTILVALLEEIVTTRLVIGVAQSEADSKCCGALTSGNVRLSYWTVLSCYYSFACDNFESCIYTNNWDNCAFCATAQSPLLKPVCLVGERCPGLVASYSNSSCPF